MKAIITDLDRTLLRTDKTLSAYTLSVLKACREKGIRLLAASARPVRNIRSFDEQICFDAIAASNGAVVLLPDKKLEYGIPCASGERILAEILRFDDIFLSVETNKGLFSNRDIPIWQPMLYDRFPSLPQDVTLYKILVSSSLPAVYSAIGSLLTDDVYHTLAGESLIQIMSRNATKWQGIKHMLDHFGILPNEAVYFGDDNDDVQPLAQCGLGIAVANAIPAAIQAADRIADSNDQDGVAKFIETFIL